MWVCNKSHALTTSPWTRGSGDPEERHGTSATSCITSIIGSVDASDTAVYRTLSLCTLALECVEVRAVEVYKSSNPSS